MSGSQRRSSSSGEMEKYTRGKLLGKGSYGSAILCTSNVDGKHYVIKEIDIARMPSQERVSSEQEAKVRGGRHGHGAWICCVAAPACCGPPGTRRTQSRPSACTSTAREKRDPSASRAPSVRPESCAAVVSLSC